MALEVLNEDLNKEYEKLKEAKNRIVGCRIKIDDGLVKVTIPSRQLNIIKKNENNIIVDEEILTFSKREIKELLQDLYIN